jgi:hypothetical protein
VIKSILSGESYIGITERIIDGKLVILGGREGLRRQRNKDIKRYFLDDMARISKYYNQVSDFF